MQYCIFEDIRDRFSKQFELLPYSSCDLKQLGPVALRVWGSNRPEYYFLRSFVRFCFFHFTRNIGYINNFLTNSTEKGVLLNVQPRSNITKSASAFKPPILPHQDSHHINITTAARSELSTSRAYNSLHITPNLVY